MGRNVIQSILPTKRIGTKIMLGMIVTSLLVIMVVTTILLNKYQADAHQNKVDAWSSNAKIIALDAALALSFQDESAAKETLSTLKRDDDLIDAYVLDSEKQVLASFDPGQHQASAFEASDSSKLAHEQNEHEVTITEPVSHQGELLGWVVTRYNLSSLKAMEADNIAYAIYIGGAGILLAILISIPIRILIQRPIKELASVARHVSESKDYAQRARRMTRDELGDLTVVFNQMLEQVERHGNEMKDANEMLDEKVRQRTEELETAFARVEAASAAKTDFLANMSHEIRTPMTSIIGYSELLLNPKHSPSDRLDCIQTIRRNGEHLLGIINDILDISKIEAGKMTTERIDCDLLQLVADVASIMRMRALSKNLTFEVDYLGPIPKTINTDPTRLRQVLVNLIGNATKFTEAGGSIRLIIQHLPASTSGHEQMQFQVIDTGIGISKAGIANLFRAFTQADETMTRRFGGTGLGLAISSHLAEQLGGTITVQSKEGVGSTFTFTADAGALEGVEFYADAREAHAIAMTSAQENHAESLAGKYSGRILVAEDGLDNQRLISQVLAFYGFEVSVVENGQLARDAAWGPNHDPAFDLILMDMQMPVLDGYRATQLLRTEGYTGPIVALTAHAMASDRQRCLDVGCDDYTTKPINRQELIELLTRYIPQNCVSNSAGRAVVEAVPVPSPTTEKGTGSAVSAGDNPHAQASGVLHSTYKDDPIIADMLDDYLTCLVEQIKDIDQAVLDNDYDRLTVLTHQVKGAAGGYGYPSISEAARALEMKSKDHAGGEDLSACAAELAELADAAIRAGSPEHQEGLNQ